MERVIEETKKRGRSELLEAFEKLKPAYLSPAEAMLAVSAELNQLASAPATSADDLLQEAHTTTDSKEHHHRALQLERQLNFLLEL